jgi:hypothetical protein
VSFKRKTSQISWFNRYWLPGTELPAEVLDKSFVAEKLFFCHTGMEEAIWLSHCQCDWLSTK